MQISHSKFTSCSWCGTRNSWGALECSRCGGPQPAIEVADAGPKPPLIPRNVPHGYQLQVFIMQVTGLVGAIFLVVGLPFMIVFPIIGLSTRIWAFLLIGGGLGGFFVAIGFFMFVMGLARVRRQSNIYRNGQVAVGNVTAIAINRSISANNRHPWKVDYVYQVMGVSYSGYANAWHLTVEKGSPLHVLYLPIDPDESVLYPPLSSRKP